jgi:hypothetical protein
MLEQNSKLELEKQQSHENKKKKKSFSSREKLFGNEKSLTHFDKQLVILIG